MGQEKCLVDSESKSFYQMFEKCSLSNVSFLRFTICTELEEVISIFVDEFGAQRSIEKVEAARFRDTGRWSAWKN